MPHGESTERVLWTECNVWPTDTNSRSHAPILYDKVNLSHLFSQFTASEFEEQQKSIVCAQSSNGGLAGLFYWLEDLTSAECYVMAVSLYMS